MAGAGGRVRGVSRAAARGCSRAVAAAVPNANPRSGMIGELWMLPPKHWMASEAPVASTTVTHPPSPGGTAWDHVVTYPGLPRCPAVVSTGSAGAGR